MSRLYDDGRNVYVATFEYNQHRLGHDPLQDQVNAFLTRLESGNKVHEENGTLGSPARVLEVLQPDADHMTVVYSALQVRDKPE